MKRLDEQVYCRVCNNKNYHEILNTYEEQNEPEDDFQWVCKHHIVRCAGCHNVSFVKQYGDEDMLEYNNNGVGEWYDKFTVYPEPPPVDKIDLNTINEKLFRNVPETIHNLYRQTLDVYNQGYLLLGTVGIRTLIEAICLDVGIESGTLMLNRHEPRLNKKEEPITSSSLEGKIYGLYELGMIIWEQSLILQTIRDMGNAAAHEIKEPKNKEFSEAVQIVEQVLTNVYELKVHKLIRGGA